MRVEALFYRVSPGIMNRIALRASQYAVSNPKPEFWRSVLCFLLLALHFCTGPNSPLAKGEYSGLPEGGGLVPAIITNPNTHLPKTNISEILTYIIFERIHLSIQKQIVSPAARFADFQCFMQTSVRRGPSFCSRPKGSKSLVKVILQPASRFFLSGTHP
jgi:hypothetical protein